MPGICKSSSSILIYLTPFKLYRFCRSLYGITILGSCLFLCSFWLIPPIVMIPPLELKHKLKLNFSPLFGECFSTIFSKISDYLLGAKPKIPLAFCDKNKLVSLLVYPKFDLICSSIEYVSNLMSSSTMYPCNELP